MNPDQWLNNKLNEIMPSDTEEEAIRKALDFVETTFEQKGGHFRIAERYPCGSFMKRTMLAGRREADLALIMVEKPTEDTLDQIETMMRSASRVRQANKRWKAVQVEFYDGVQVDVLPVAKQGITEDAEKAEERFKIACNSKPHVQWFIQNAHRTPIHPTVRLMKYLRSRRRVWQEIHSFGIEILCVNILHNYSASGLSKYIEQVLRKVASGYLLSGQLLDPVDSSRDIIQGMTSDTRQAITDDAMACVRAIENESWSAVFAESSWAVPPPAANIGGRTLA